jgi:DNA-binding MarR family transcriptional regulator
MTSLFDPPIPPQDMSSKIMAGLERLSQALRGLLWAEAKTYDLSPIQIQFLIYLCYHPLKFCRVSTLAKEFSLTQATVSDAVTSLESKNLLYREVWSEDRRILTLRLTTAGGQLAIKLSTWAMVVKEQLNQFPPAEQEQLMKLLMQLIESLQRVGVIATARICFTCRFFQDNAHPTAPAPHHCRLLDKTLANSELRLDCPEYELALT